jgi:hypothetical protein
LPLQVVILYRLQTLKHDMGRIPRLGIVEAEPLRKGGKVAQETEEVGLKKGVLSYGMIGW